MVILLSIRFLRRPLIIIHCQAKNIVNFEIACMKSPFIDVSRTVIVKELFYNITYTSGRPVVKMAQWGDRQGQITRPEKNNCTNKRESNPQTCMSAHTVPDHYTRAISTF